MSFPYSISIHAPANGATGGVKEWYHHNKISIHAPANGATGARSIKTGSEYNFNPRSGERSDVSWGVACYYHTYFNPRSGERSDQVVDLLLTIFDYFNPRSGERSDLTSSNAMNRRLIFQSTLRRTERLCVLIVQQPVLLFQSTLRRTERRKQDEEIYYTLYFNPRSGERSDQMAETKLDNLNDFNPRSGERSDGIS